MTDRETVGFIGVGIMGKPMVLNLLEAGFAVVVHSRSAGPVDEVVAEGAKRGESAADVAGQVDVVISMVPDTPDVEAVLLNGPDPVIEGVRAGQLVIDMSTISPVATKRIAAAFAAKAVAFLDAPVSGGEKGAIDGALSIMVGGREEDFARAKPIFEVLGKSVVLVGPSGAGQVTKACNQLVVAANIEAVAEALVLAAKAGVDPAKVRKALLGGFAGSKILEVHGQRMLAGTFDPGFRIRLHRKDARIIEETAKELDVPTPAFERVVAQLQRLIDEDGGEFDHSALVKLLEQDAGIEVAAAVDAGA
ncbi:MAG: 2-hydroxy-3-oxopropionate reductase [Actinomycetota bacterium]